ncbi:MBL fold metallo-hydrolase [Streptomyces sp. 891-h]|uniref:MBL fold metallo-hydrolase n=1 Tax=Streptomyces sp. 891-h TaxID=2720714 RepID=UPI001FA96EDA|nr:MBL fold metallo-hydrolase [Streptomyces sp. 891-h]UNZ16669.1 MBL fold metallo-hydrolase [Streptomyces sp. 891-h]
MPIVNAQQGPRDLSHPETHRGTNPARTPETSPAASPGERLRRPGRLRSLRLGDVKVTYLPDGAVDFDPRAWLPESTEDYWAAHAANLDDSGRLIGGVGGLLVEREGRALLIDAGFGPHAEPARPGYPRGAMHGGALLDSLAAAGRSPAEIEAVAFTHLHRDHIGWAWSPVPGSDVLPFGDCPYLVAEPEWKHRRRLGRFGVTEEILQTMAPRVRTVSDGEEIFPGVRMVLGSGHTAGHARYDITAGSERLIAFGDAMHSPLQVDRPEWAAAVDLDAGQAALERRLLVAELARTGAIGFGVHFADVVFGRVRLDGCGTAWRPLD